MRSWFRDYKQLRGMAAIRSPLREEAWVETAHFFVSSILAEPAKKNLWARVEKFRVHDVVTLSFHDCNTIPVNITVKSDSKYLRKQVWDSNKYNMVMVDSVTSLLALGFGLFWAVVLVMWLLILCYRCCFGKARKKQR
jgi:hypothetical protein